MKKLKWNWGTKIALFYTIFVVFTLFMVYLASSQQYDLVTEDYYAQEIAYQGTIDSKERVKDLKNILQTSIEGNQLKITFPNEGQAIQGSINCFRPSDESKDFQESFMAKNGIHAIPLSQFIRGKYILKIKWGVLSDGSSKGVEMKAETETKESTTSLNNLNYYQEQIIIIP
jgi:hypothetical protein